MTHTPGPWSIKRTGAAAAPLAIRNGIETIAAFPRGTDKDYEADARLIAAAPELLQMLEGIVEGIVQAREPTWSADQKQAFLNGLADAARAAIARAKGE